MLKIKDSIDLNILKKYGFVKKEQIGDIDVDRWFIDKWIDDNGNYCDAPPLDKSKIDWVYWENGYSYINEKDLSGDAKDREIYKEDFDINILFDLIKDGLVEKI